MHLSTESWMWQLCEMHPILVLSGEKSHVMIYRGVTQFPNWDRQDNVGIRARDALKRWWESPLISAEQPSAEAKEAKRTSWAARQITRPPECTGRDTCSQAVSWIRLTFRLDDRRLQALHPAAARTENIVQCEEFYNENINNFVFEATINTRKGI